MAGNVAEWVQDNWADTYDVAPDDGSAYEDGDVTARVHRGAGYDSPAADLRSANRSKEEPTVRHAAIGARCVREE